MLCKTPLSREYLLSGGVSGRDSRFRAQTRLGSDGVLRRRQERLSVKISAGLLESRLGLIMGDFPFCLSPQTVLASRNFGCKLFGKTVLVWTQNVTGRSLSSSCYSDEILASVLTVFQFLVVAPTDNAFSIALLESLVLP